MDHGPEEVAAVLAAIRDGAVAWSTSGDLMRATELDRERVDCALTMLWSMGLVETTGGMTGEEAWTFTPLAAEGLGVVLRNRKGLLPRPFWRERVPAHARTKTRRHAHISPTPAADLGDALNDLVDPSPGPAELAEQSDDVRAWKPRGPFSVDKLPNPTHLLYDDGLPWQEIALSYRLAEACRICHGRKLRPEEYCLSCRRWGFDGLIVHHKKLAERIDADRAAMIA